MKLERYELKAKGVEYEAFLAQRKND